MGSPLNGCGKLVCNADQCRGGHSGKSWKLWKNNEGTPLAIEVKGQAVVARSEFTLYLTSHEWRTAIALGDQYVFHLWDGVRPGDPGCGARTEPLLIRPDMLKRHVPSHPNCGSTCEWKSACISLPLPF